MPESSFSRLAPGLLAPGGVLDKTECAAQRALWRRVSATARRFGGLATQECDRLFALALARREHF